MSTSDFPQKLAELKKLPDAVLRERLRRALKELYGKPAEWSPPKGESLAYTVMCLENDLRTIQFFKGRKPAPQGGGVKAASQPSQRPQARGDVVPSRTPGGATGMVGTPALATALRKQLRRHGLKEAKKGETGAA